jgi:hypothetical protein
MYKEAAEKSLAEKMNGLIDPALNSQQTPKTTTEASLNKDKQKRKSSGGIYSATDLPMLLNKASKRGGKGEIIVLFLQTKNSEVKTNDIPE